MFIRRSYARKIKLFGGLPETVKNEQTGKDETTGGQGAFLLRVTSQSNLNILDDWPTAASFSGYLGIGLWKTNKQPHRQALEEGQVFGVELLLKPGISNNDKAALKDTLKAWGWFGGLGSRVRRGFGSIALEQLGDQDMAFASADEYVKAIKQLLTSYKNNDVEPIFTAFSSQTMLGLAATKANARSAHEELGRLFKSYRGQPSILRGSQKRVFGMPYAVGTYDGIDKRRASPLIFHVHPVANKYKGLVLSLPAVFYHDEEPTVLYHEGTTLKEVDNKLLSGFIKQLQEVSLWT